MSDDLDRRGYEPTRRPALLDVVKIDNLWAQTMAGGDTIRYLDDMAVTDIKWEEYTLVNHYDSSVKILQTLGKIRISDQEIANIHWGSEQEQTPELRLQVKVFGEYVKK